jgi:5-methylcytosine-specific restriction endonuclease McrA
VSLGFPKPERAARKADKRKAQLAHKRTRKVARNLVWRREGGTADRDARCQRCGRVVSRDVSGFRDERAQFNEMLPKSLGGSDTDPDNIELTCRVCHFGGPSGGHAPTADRMVKKPDA